MLLHSLTPHVGPRDGGTRVKMQALGLQDGATNLTVWLSRISSLQAADGREGGTAYEPTLQLASPRVPAVAMPAELFPGGWLHFTTPNATEGSGLGMLVALSWIPRAPGQLQGASDDQSELAAASSSSSTVPQSKPTVPDEPHMAMAGPLFFRLTEPLARLGPSWVSPCCDFKLSGGENIVLAGFVRGAPSDSPVVRFRGAEEQLDVVGQILSHDAGAEHDKAPAGVWLLSVNTPPWPRAETQIVIEVSWNNQQFVRFDTPTRFEEEQSFFGNVAMGIKEDHLAKAAIVEETPEATPSEQSVDAPAGPVVLPASADRSDLESSVQEETVSVLLQDKGEDGGNRDMSGAVLVNSAGDAFVLSRASDLSHLQEDSRLVHDLLLLTCVVALGGALARLVAVPSIIGFLLGGVAVGPGCLDIVQELVQVESVAELGVCLLLFSLGLELSWRELLANKRAAAAGLLNMVMLCGFVALLAAFCTGTDVNEALCIGLFASLASTPVSLQAMPHFSPAKKSEMPELEIGGPVPDEEASVMLSVLVAQDMALAVLLAVMPRAPPRSTAGQSRAEASTGDAAAGGTIVGGISKLTLPVFLRPGLAVVLAQFLLMALVCQRRCRCRLMTVQMSQKLHVWLLSVSSEGFTLSVVSYMFICSYLSDWMGLSLEMGAFVGGVALSTLSPELAERALEQLTSVKHFFVSLFFGSIGLVVSPRFLLDNLVAVLSVVAFVFLVKLFTGFLPLWLLASRSVTARSALTALRISWVLAHVGEFGFVLAAKGAAWGALSRHVYLLLIGANAVSLCCAPWLFRFRDFLLPPLYSSMPSVQRSTSPKAGLGADRSRPGARHIGLGRARTPENTAV